MRLGCGCVLAVALLVVLAGGAMWVAVKILQEPMLPLAAAGSSGSEAKVEALRRPHGEARTTVRGGTITLSQAEVAALLARHLPDAGDLPLSDVRVGLPEAGLLDLAGRTPLRTLLKERPLSRLAEAVPTRWLERRVWISLRATSRVEAGAAGGRRRYLRLEITRFAVGRVPLPGMLVRLVLDPATVGLLRWPLPDGVEEIRPEKGRVVIRIAS